MGRESAHWVLALAGEDEAKAAAALFEALDVERAPDDPARRDFVLRDPYRFWIDLRIHERPLRLEVRIALTNDTWAIRAPLERVLTALEPTLGGRSWCDEDGREVATFGADGWSLALEDDYARMRDAFVARVGDFNAPISADHTAGVVSVSGMLSPRRPMARGPAGADARGMKGPDVVGRDAPLTSDTCRRDLVVLDHRRDGVSVLAPFRASISIKPRGHPSSVSQAA